MPTICELIGIDIPLYVNGIYQKKHLDNPNKYLREHCLLVDRI